MKSFGDISINHEREFTGNKIWVYRDLRTNYIEKYGNFNFMRYAVLEMIKLYRKPDNLIYESGNKFLVERLNVSKGTISNHIKMLIKFGLIIKTKQGLRLSNKLSESEFNKNQKGSFTILYIEIWRKFNNDFYSITFEWFAILSCLISISIMRYRSTSQNTIAIWLNIDRKTVNSAISFFKEINIVTQNETKSLVVNKDFINDYFEEYVLNIKNSRNNH